VGAAAKRAAARKARRKLLEARRQKRLRAMARPVYPIDARYVSELLRGLGRD
jgi:hypothetical protein